jgi:hypothetical protein
MLAAISYCCCPFWGIFQLYKLEGELNRYLGKGDGGSILWFLFGLIPLLGMPKLIGEARAKAGTATQGDGSLIMYLLLGIYAIPKDANEVWEKLGVQPKLGQALRRCRPRRQTWDGERSMRSPSFLLWGR